jgi:hypothetical protein
MPLSSINRRSNNGGSLASDFSFFFQDPAKRKESQSGMIEMLRKSPLVFSLFAASVIPFQPADAQEQNPAQEENPAGNVVTQAESTSTSQEADMNLLSNLPVHLSLALHGGYDDNVSTGAGGGQGSFFTSAGLTLFYSLHGTSAGVGGSSFGTRPGGAFGPSSSASEPTQLTINSGASVSYYPGATRVRTTDVDTFLNLSLSHYFSPRVSVTASVNAAYRTEPDFSSNIGAENVRANYFYTADSASAEYHWTPLFSSVTSDVFDRIQYDSSSVGTSINRSENTVGEEFRFSWRPDISLIANYRFQLVDYDSSLLNSTTHFALVGIQKEFNPQLKAVVRGGATFRSYKDDGSRTDPNFEGSLVYVGAHNSTLSWSTRYGVEEPTLTASPTIQSRTTFRTGLQVEYALSARISARLGGYYHHDENHGFNSTGNVSSGFNSTGNVSSGFSSDSFEVSLGVRYAIRRYFTFDLDYQHSEVTSGQSARDYSRNRYSAGLTFTY